MTDEPPEVLSAAQKTELQQLIDATLLGDAYLIKFELDLFDQEVTIKARVPWSADDVHAHTIVFRGVQALFYQNGLMFAPSNTATDTRLANALTWPWMGYEYYNRPVVVKVVDPPHGLEKVDGVRMDFALDLNLSDTVILISASGVKIDDEDFYVGQPRIPSENK